MNAFQRLLIASDQEKKTRGLQFTPIEIAQQPDTWVAAAKMLIERRQQIGDFLASSGMTGQKRATVILTGAGSSEFVGNAAAPAMRRALGRTVISIPTTHLVTDLEVFTPGESYVVVSFARSGNSPESMATYNLVKRLNPQAMQIAITCNPDGALAKATSGDANGLYIALPPETNDQSLVMTSSYTTMAFTAVMLGYLNQPDRITRAADRLAGAGRRIISEYGDLLERFANRSFTRVAFLGSGALCGAMQECHLKMVEMTDGRVATIFNSFVGLRHGPQVFINNDAVVVAALASDPFVRRYEIDMLRELQAKKQGQATLVICDRATDEIRSLCTDVIELFPNGDAISDDLRIMTDVMVGQILGTFKCLSLGLKPDTPSASGTINRVVQGVTIYDYPGKA